MQRKHIMRITIYFIIFCVIFVTVSNILKSNSNNTRRINGFYAEEKDSLDVIFIGTSIVETFIIPPLAYKEFGFTSYNLCFDGTSPQLYKLLLSEALTSQKPKVVVFNLNVDESDYTNDQLRAILDNMRWSKNKSDFIRQYDQDTSIWSYIFPISKYHTRWKDLSPALGYTYFMIFENKNYDALNYYNAYELFIKKTYPLKGFYTFPKASPQIEIESPQNIIERINVGSKYIETINELIGTCEETNVTPLFFFSPEPLINQNSIENYKKQLAVIDYIQEQGYDCLDFNSLIEEMSFDYVSDLGDTAHANIYGAEKITRYISNYLVENYNLKSKHPEDVKSEWDKAYSVWINCEKYIKERTSEE